MSMLLQPIESATGHIVTARKTMMIMMVVNLMTPRTTRKIKKMKMKKFMLMTVRYFFNVILMPLFDTRFKHYTYLLKYSLHQLISKNYTTCFF